jgi:hypothetical protein
MSSVLPKWYWLKTGLLATATIKIINTSPFTKKEILSYRRLLFAEK